jgi:hypothetical protein
VKPPSRPVNGDQDHAQDRNDHEGDEEQRHADEDRDLRRLPPKRTASDGAGDRYRREG